jgi:uracil-DNA glycosylase
MDDILPEPVDLVGLFPKYWREIIDISSLDKTSRKLSKDFLPSDHEIFNALDLPPDKVRVVIVGQDPYPNSSHAMGLAFSVRKDVHPLPASLKNIFIELQNDLGYQRKNGDLSDWKDQGVLLLNRALTVSSNGLSSHRDIGWELVTEPIIAHVARNGAVGVLWGKQASKLEKYFTKSNVIASPHPSPLSAYRGFFGSKPFSKVNKILRSKGEEEIKW